MIEKCEEKTDNLNCTRYNWKNKIKTMKHDKNLVVNKDIQVSFYKILLFALLLHIYKYLQLIK